MQNGLGATNQQAPVDSACADDLAHHQRDGQKRDQTGHEPAGYVERETAAQAAQQPAVPAHQHDEDQDEGQEQPVEYLAQVHDGDQGQARDQDEERRESYEEGQQAVKGGSLAPAPAKALLPTEGFRDGVGAGQRDGSETKQRGGEESESEQQLCEAPGKWAEGTRRVGGGRDGRLPMRPES